MTHFVRLQLLICLMLYAACAQAIMVKFGTKEGPIEPPVPTTELPAHQPYRAPAPVWESRTNDAPDPNAEWRPQLFVPYRRYTNIIFNVPSATPKPITNAQRFANSYIPRRQPAEPIKAQPITNYFTPAQMLSSLNLPGFGIRYFIPSYLTDWKKREQQQDDEKYNQLETNIISVSNRVSGHEAQSKYEKEASKRIVRNTEPNYSPYVYEWPAFVTRRYH